MSTNTAVAIETRMPHRVLHTMLRVANLDRSIEFYTQMLGMRLFRKERYPDGKFTLAFLGYGREDEGAVLELTENWGRAEYSRGDAYGHVALAVADIHAVCGTLKAKGGRILREPGPMSNASPDRISPEVIAFIEDPDGYRIELIEEPKR